MMIAILLVLLLITFNNIFNYCCALLTNGSFFPWSADSMIRVSKGMSAKISTPRNNNKITGNYNMINYCNNCNVTRTVV